MTKRHYNTLKQIGKVSQLLLPHKFSGKLYRSCLPKGTYDTNNEVLQQWNNRNISIVICLLNDEEIQQKTNITINNLYDKQYNIKRIPIRKYYIPINIQDMKLYLYYILLCLYNGKNVVIHCSAGIGRTGLLYTILLLFLRYSLQSVKKYVSSQLISCYNTTNPKQHQYIQYFNNNL